jgi:hypothetical protein
VVTPDGKRFLLIENPPEADREVRPFTLVQQFLHEPEGM